MSVTASGLFFPTFRDILDASALPVDLVSDTIKGALFTNAITPNFSSDTAYAAAPYNANEVSGTGYTAGGATLASKTVSEDPTGTLKFDAADLSWPGSTITNARCLLLWDDTVASPVADPALALVNFGADFSTIAGTFAVQFAAAGIFFIDLTP